MSVLGWGIGMISHLSEAALRLELMLHPIYNLHCPIQCLVRIVTSVIIPVRNTESFTL